MGWCESRLTSSPPSRLGKVLAKSPYGWCLVHICDGLTAFWVPDPGVSKVKRNTDGSLFSCVKKYNVYSIPWVPGTGLNVFQCNQTPDWSALRGCSGKAESRIFQCHTWALMSLPESLGFSCLLDTSCPLSLDGEVLTFTNEYLISSKSALLKGTLKAEMGFTKSILRSWKNQESENQIQRAHCPPESAHHGPAQGETHHLSCWSSV